ncbi:MAG TPA: VOC family protein [Limnochordia bacterium]|nr:VOC family protein [Limnochordia bacterium]
MSIQVQHCHHVAFAITDTARAKAFYGGLLGLREIARPAFAFDGVWYDLGGDQQLHLIVYPKAKTLRHDLAPDGLDAHLALRVADYDQALAALQAAGLTVRANPDSITGWAQMFCTDPDGNVIELNAPRGRFKSVR